MVKTAVDVKNSELVGKTSSPRDSQPDPDDLDTVLVSSDAIQKAREEAESVTSETATVDCHPIILDDSEEDTGRFVGDDASSSGLVTKKLLKVSEGKSHSPAMLDDDEVVELSDNGIVVEFEPAPAKQEPRATITEVREVVALAKARANDETMPMPKTELVGLLETVPLNSALVQNVLAQVDARAAARAEGKPIPELQVSSTPPVMPPAQPALRQAAPRKLAMEIFITVAAFLFVAVPALYYLWVSFKR